jgi:hypothetical protein
MSFFCKAGNTLTADEHRKMERLLANKEDVEYNPIDHIQERIQKNRGKPTTLFRGRGRRCALSRAEPQPEVQ